MADGDAVSSSQELEPREPSLEDVVELCRNLNAVEAKYIIVGGFAMRAAGLARQTLDVDLLIETGEENETRVFKALEYLPDQAVKELHPGEVAEYVVVRIADEIMIDLMRSACGVDYQEASHQIDWKKINNVEIPFASPKLLWRLKQTVRAKDEIDRQFLRRILGETLCDTNSSDLSASREAKGLLRRLFNWLTR